MTDRAEALHALRPARAAGLPAPPPRPIVVLPDLEPESSKQDHAASDIDTAEVASASLDGGDASPKRRQAQFAETSDGQSSIDTTSFAFAALVDRPVETCKAMTDIRASQASKPLNVDITPDTADAFDERCRTLRVKKKDVVEVLLRAWLEAGDSPRPNRSD